MRLFVVLRVSDPEKMGRAINEAFPGQHLWISDKGEWLIAAGWLTTREVFDRLGDDAGGCIILHFDAYWGQARNEIWEWIASRMQE